MPPHPRRCPAARVLTAALACVLSGAMTARGQSINVDLSSDGPAQGAPDSTFAGPAGQAGVWNNYVVPQGAAVATLVNQPMTTPDGQSTGAKLQLLISSASTRVSVYNPASAIDSDISRLLDDGVRARADGGDPNGSVTLRFTGLRRGSYTLTLIVQPWASGAGVFTLGAGTSLSPVIGVSAAPVTGFVDGVTHASLSTSVGDDGTLSALCLPSTSDPETSPKQLRLAGAQLRFQGIPRLYVNPAIPTPGDGSSWARAQNNLASALRDAATMGNPPEVWVTRGTHTPGATRDASFVVPPGVRLRGGFVGTETELAQRADPLSDAYLTILSGNIGRASDNADNTRHVVRLGAGATLDGLVIRDGYADASTGADQYGGGVLISSPAGSYTLTRCLLLNNTARIGAGLAAVPLTAEEFTPGAAPARSLTLDRVVVRGGGVIAGEGAGDPGVRIDHASVRLDRCRIVANAGPGYAVNLVDCTGVVRSSLIAGNAAGGLSVRLHDAPTSTLAPLVLEHCTISANTPVDDSQGLLIAAPPASAWPVRVSGNIIWGNPVAPGTLEYTLEPNTAGDGLAAYANENTLSGPIGTRGILATTTTGEPDRNSDADPRFEHRAGAAPGDDLYTLAVDSPALDACSPPSDVDAADLDGRAYAVDLAGIDNTGLSVAGVPGLADRGCLERPDLVPSVSPCSRADITDASGTGSSDGQLTGQDVVTFFHDFFAPCTRPIPPCSRADLTDLSGLGAPDGSMTAADLVAFFGDYFLSAGCR